MKSLLLTLLSLYSVVYCGISTTNPWLNVDFFINPDFVAEVQTAISAYPDQQPLLQNAQGYPVAYWVDSIAKIPNVTRVLNFAKTSQQTTGRRVLVEFIIYDLPNRDCAAGASNGEITCEDSNCANGINMYKTQYIDPIVNIMSQFPDVTIVALIEPDSLPNLSTNLNIAKCATASTAYVQGTAYAIKQLATLPNVAIYIDAAHGGWLGWPNNLQSIAQTFNQVLSLAGGVNLIRGFATNTANYQPLGSMASTDDPCKLGSQYNNAIDEVHYINLLNQALTSAGITGKGYITDTSRNGVTNTRQSCSNWCNIKGAGLGVRPTANTAYTGLSVIDAFHWAKVPGESDGTSDSNAARYDSKCSSVDSVSGAPQAGQWFGSYFLALCQNAQPTLLAAGTPTTPQTPTPQTPTPTSSPVITPGTPNSPNGSPVIQVVYLKNGTHPSTGLSVGATAGIIVAAIVLVSVLIVVIIVILVRRRRNKGPAPSLTRGESVRGLSSADLLGSRNEITKDENLEAGAWTPPIRTQPVSPTVPRPTPVSPATMRQVAMAPTRPAPVQPVTRAVPMTPTTRPVPVTPATPASPPQRRLPPVVRDTVVIPTLPPGWEIKKTPDGKQFYQNKETGESSWEVPQ